MSASVLPFWEGRDASSGNWIWSNNPELREGSNYPSGAAVVFFFLRAVATTTRFLPASLAA